MATDIQTEKLIFKILPRGLHPYVKLARLDRPIGTWLLLLPCWWGIVLAAGGFAALTPDDGLLIILFALGALLMRGAGCVVNDLWDRDLDAKVERTKTRPLPAGDVTVKQAVAFLAVLLACSLAILLSLNGLCIRLGFLSLVLVGTYPLMKRVTWWPQLFLGFTFNWGALMGWAAVNGNFNPVDWTGVSGIAQVFFMPAVWLYAGGILWTLAYDTVYAHQDKEDDATIGVRSTARLFAEESKNFVGICFLLAMICFGTAKFFAAPSAYTALFTVPVVAHALWQMKTWRMDDPQSCLAVFKSNRDFGLLVLLLFGF